ncbi:MAG: hypothetical protein J2P31_11415, partial [Blastocatellia bacterium]|nr:hypothetical protein [Blastocatellia bacterium]
MPRKKNSDLATHETKNIHLEKDHAGRDVWTLRKRFPDGYTLRRRMPRDSAAKLLKRIETAIDYGPEGPRGWKELKKELNHETNSGAKAIPRMTVSSLADLYFNEYCITHHDKETQEFKRQHLDKIKELVGDKLIATFTMDDGEYVKRERLKQKIANSEKRKDETVSPNTVHKTHRVLCHMFNWASDPKYGKEYLVKNPVAGMKSLKQRRYQRQDLPPEDWAQILEAAYAIDHFKATFIALCGELAVRPWAEGITLKRRLFDMRPRVNPRDERWLMIEPSKHDPEGRRIPLSDEAIALARSLPVVVGSEYLFTNPDGTLLSR